MAQVIWTDKALAELEAIVRFVAQDSPSYAHRLGAAILRAPRRLREMPLSGRIVPEFGHDDEREVIHGMYRIIYVLRGGNCHVVAVVHSSRDFLQTVHREDWPK